MAGTNSVINFCFIISLSIHFGLGFFLFPFSFFTPVEKAAGINPVRNPAKFIEVAFLKNEKNKYSLQSRSSCASALDEDETRLSPGEEKKDNRSGAESIAIAEQLEIDLTNFGDELSPVKLPSDYADILRVCILKKIIYPMMAFRNNMQGTVQLKFVLLADGNLKDAYVVKSSNSLLLDTAALNAVEQANPFPPFPENLRTKELFVKVPIIYRLN